ncbi:MAG: hypothetical protein ACTSPX_00660 [Candidatus Thorarchaeota archaeon]
MLELLFKLQEMPMAPAKRLAEEIGRSTPTVISWLKKLARDKMFLGVKPDLKVHLLGLEIYDFLLDVTNHEALLRIEEFCEKHPYTLYRARVFGGTRHGMLVQFRQPPEALPHLQEAFETMRNSGLIEGVAELPTLQRVYGSTYTRPLLEAWDPERMVWRFDWEQWWNSEIAEPDMQTDGVGSSKTASSRVEIDELDAKILQILTDNARRKNIDIIRKLGLDPREGSTQQRISKRIVKLRQVIDSYRVFINWTYFDVYNTPMVLAKASSDTTRTLIGKLQRGTFPFSSSIRSMPDGFVWYARLPSAHLSELVSLIWRICDSYELLIIDYKHSQTYGLWAETFDQKTGDWKSDWEFCVEEPLRAIGLK